MDKYSLNLTEIGKRIKELRLSLNVSQEKLGEAIGVTDNHISKIESGNTSVSLNVFIKLCKYFNVSMDYLLFGAVDKTKTKNDVIIQTLLNSFEEIDKEFIINMLKELNNHENRKRQ